MMFLENVIAVFFILQAVAIAACGPLRDPKRIFAVPVISSLWTVVFTILTTLHFLSAGPAVAFGDNLLIDALSLFHIALVTVVFLCSSVYAGG
jgi:formate hydrogenlyase subunit 3/multisubunit Na+/H+ antiporter MnhD subunit